MVSFDKKYLDRLSLEKGFVRDNLEKVIRLADILRYLHNNEDMSQSLVLKGGTAINLTVFSMPRLSVDIDLDYTINCDREQMMENRSKINDELTKYLFSEGYQMLPSSKRYHTLDSWVVGYQNAGGNKDVIKIEINYSNRCHVMPSEERMANVDFLNNFPVNVLNPVELFASKINALISRTAIRDLYDVNNMISAGLFASAEERSLLRKILVFYMTVGSNENAKDVNIEQVDTSKINGINFSQIRAQLLPVLRKSENFDFEKAKANVLFFLNDFMVFDDSEIEYVEQFKRGNYQPLLLFGEGEMYDRINKHPMALWKCREIKVKTGTR